MEVEQSTGYILQDRPFEGEGEVRHVFQEVIKACCKKFHHQQRQLSPREEAEAKELSDVRVTEARHQLALLQVLAYHHIRPLILHIYESLVEPLSSTGDVLVGHLYSIDIS